MAKREFRQFDVVRLTATIHEGRVGRVEKVDGETMMVRLKQDDIRRKRAETVLITTDQAVLRNPAPEVEPAESDWDKDARK